MTHRMDTHIQYNAATPFTKSKYW